MTFLPRSFWRFSPVCLAWTWPLALAGADASAPPPTPPRPTPAASAAPVNTAPLSPEQLKALVIVKGDLGAGTGFVVKSHGLFFIITNEHVLSGNKKFTMTGMDGTKYPVNGTLYGAKDYDVAMLQIPEALAKFHLEIDPDPMTNTKAGQVVTVPGNSDGMGVPAQSNGRLVGIGPDKVEVNAKFVRGNSGSPIIYRPTGKVIGIATEVAIMSADPVRDAADAPTSHWLGYRLDNIPSDTGWVKLDWARFSEEGQKLREIEEITDFMHILLTTQKITLTENTKIKAAVETYRTRYNQAVQQDDTNGAHAAANNFRRELNAIAKNSLKQLSSEKLYPFHANHVQELQDFWTHVDKLLQQ
jgi:hypothetical protein